MSDLDIKGEWSLESAEAGWLLAHAYEFRGPNFWLRHENNGQWYAGVWDPKGKHLLSALFNTLEEAVEAVVAAKKSNRRGEASTVEEAKNGT